ncbi:MAG: hypothetical protein VYE68_12730 [Acidobacteriota bacterium]|nr:hypothetical protein [Acidobacteriota bacterium]
MSWPYRTLSPLPVDLRNSPALSLDTIRTNFYREEFVKHRECLRQQREAYSECTISEMEAALRHVMTRIDELCAQEGSDVDELVSSLLRSFDGVTKLSAWPDPTITH